MRARVCASYQPHRSTLRPGFIDHSSLSNDHRLPTTQIPALLAREGRNMCPWCIALITSNPAWPGFVTLPGTRYCSRVRMLVLRVYQGSAPTPSRSTRPCHHAPPADGADTAHRRSLLGVSREAPGRVPVEGLAGDGLDPGLGIAPPLLRPLPATRRGTASRRYPEREARWVGDERLCSAPRRRSSKGPRANHGGRTRKGCGGAWLTEHEPRVPADPGEMESRRTQRPVGRARATAARRG